MEISLSLISLSSWDKSPSSCLTASLEANTVFEFIISITASAWDKSIRPFRKALLVNSPGDAGLAPYSTSSLSILFCTTLQENGRVKTYSVGDEPNRKVVICLK